MNAFRALPALAALCLTGLPLTARAQSDPVPRAPSPAGAQDDALPVSANEIVVTAPRYGEARVGAESEFSEGEIASHGADSVQDLLSRLAPFIGADGSTPVILINGRPAGLDRSILAYPAEALARLTVLKPEAASQYGGKQGQRVVNLVLKRRFSSLDANAVASGPMRGGAFGWQGSATRTAISGDTRWNAQIQITRDGSLRRNQRNVPPRTGVFDNVGFVEAPDGGEIDPALSGGGAPVTIAAIPPGTHAGGLLLADFRATRGETHPVDPNAYETLQPRRHLAVAILGVSRPIGSWAASLNLTAAQSSDAGSRGLPMAVLRLPAGNPFSPFGRDVLLTRSLAGDRALRSNNDNRSLSATVSLTGAVAGWQTSFALGYLRSWSHNLLEIGIDAEHAQQRLDLGDPGLDPFGPWRSDLLLATRGRSIASSLSALLSLQRKLLDLPAGPVNFTIAANASRDSNSFRQSDAQGGAGTAADLARQQLDSTFSLNLPISQRGMAGIGALGDLSADVSLGIQRITGTPLQKRYSGGLSWSPARTVQFRAAIGIAEVAPSVEQLDGPVQTLAARVFDYSSQAVVDAIWITGGNPDLRRGSQQSLSLSTMLRPLGGQTLSLNFGYQQSVAKKGVAPFPELTPAIEAVFPERVTRDPSGQLRIVDARAINIARSRVSSLNSAVALRFPTAGKGAPRPGADPVQFSLSLTYGLALRNELEIRRGAPVVDQLRGGGSASRHMIGAQFSAGRRDLGVHVDGAWRSPTRIAANGAAGEGLRIDMPILFNVSAFALPDASNGHALWKGVKVALDVQNVLNGYRHVRRADGTQPPGFSRDEVDPIGRTFRISVRKPF